MPSTVRVHLLPSLFEPEDLAGGVAVVIDVLRASTTITAALHAGAKEVIPCETVDEALAAARVREPGTVLLGGERGGVQIDGFDLDNCPRRYTADIVSGRTVVFTTTNGTRVLHRASSADRVLIGAFVNQRALVRELAQEQRPIHLLCAGTNDRLTSEDILFAGAVAAELMERGASPAEFDVATEMSLLFAREHSRDDGAIREALRTSIGGRNLSRLGMEADIAYAASRDLFDGAAIWDRTTNAIRLPNR
jgi:2-phosphosulfolactate phosphatase